MRPSERNHRRNYNEPGHAHVLTFSCYRGYQFLAADRTCHWLAQSIDAARGEFDFALWAYVFMPEHVHLVIWPRLATYDIAVIRGAIKAPVGKKAVKYIQRESPEWLPKITRQRGRKTERLFWQSGGGYDRNIESPAALGNEIDYIHMNPVRRGLVDEAAQWKWSSAAWYVAGVQLPLRIDAIPSEWIA